MKPIARASIALLVAGSLLAACGGKSDADETARLRAEVAVLKELMASTTTTAAPTTTSSEPTTTTKPAPTTTSTRPPTTTTTVKKPQGVVSWRVATNDVIGDCAYVKYHLVNRSDTAVESVTIKDVDVTEERDAGSGPGSGARWVDNPFSAQTVPAGIAPFGGETDVQMKWCYTLGHGLPPGITTADITAWYPYYVDNGPDKTSATLTWKWFGHPPSDVGTTIG